jgi:hypothetical protein
MDKDIYSCRMIPGSGHNIELELLTCACHQERQPPHAHTSSNISTSLAHGPLRFHAFGIPHSHKGSFNRRQPRGRDAMRTRIESALAAWAHLATAYRSLRLLFPSLALLFRVGVLGRSDSLTPDVARSHSRVCRQRMLHSASMRTAFDCYSRAIYTMG